MSHSLCPVEITQKLIQCPSVTPLEGGALDYLNSLLAPSGFEVSRPVFSDTDTPDIENFFAKIQGGEGPHLSFAGHTDVVPTGEESLWTLPPFAGEVRDGMIYGRGTADMKGGVAAFAAASLRYLGEHGAPKGTLSFLITGDEEGPAINGTIKLLKWAAERGEAFDACIVGEPTNPNALGDAIKVGRRGSQSGWLTIRGKQGHVAYPHLALNPVPLLAKIVAHINYKVMDQGTDFFQPTNLEFVTFDVGNPASNVIPESAKARFNCRYNDLWNKDKIETFLHDCIAECGLPDGFEVVLDLEPDLSQVFLTKSEDLISSFSDAVTKVTGKVPELSTGGGTSDARFIKDYCPVIEFGLVGQTMHQIDERVDVEDLHNLAEIYYQFLLSYFPPK
ncbi:MAG: succinyl-diaminopimelate desuccinylase [Cohaesibacter sp.]|nr:succinyl-diaminopimelate desuccinylase [Cohaesibacter sp.]MCV6603068.1 succinyl-diaminopimelate desuccinylase [Cohaesibacter sp.]